MVFSAHGLFRNFPCLLYSVKYYPHTHIFSIFLIVILPCVCVSHSEPHSEHHFPAPSFKLCQTGYTSEGALFISAQLSTDMVSALRKVWVLIWLEKQPSAKAHT